MALTLLPVVGACQRGLPTGNGGAVWRQIARDSVTLFYGSADTAGAPVWSRYAARAVQRNQQFFARQYTRAPLLRVYAQRDSFVAQMRSVFAIAQLPCWMIGAGTASEVTLLTPRVWETQACSNSADSVNVDRVITHELVHVLHRQLAPTQQLGALQWLLEGVAFLAAGQYTSSARAATIQQLRSGFELSQLESAWSSPNGYALSASMVDHIDRTRGRALLTGLLSLGSEAAVLGALQLTEAEFLQQWRADLLAGN